MEPEPHNLHASALGGRLVGFPPLAGRDAGAALRDTSGPLSVAYQTARASGLKPARAAAAAGLTITGDSLYRLDALPELRAAVARRRAALQAQALESFGSIAPALGRRAETILARLEVELDAAAPAPASRIKALTGAVGDLCRELSRIAGLGEAAAADTAAIRAEVEAALASRLVAAVQAAAPAQAVAIVRLIAAEVEIPAAGVADGAHAAGSVPAAAAAGGLAAAATRNTFSPSSFFSVLSSEKGAPKGAPLELEAESVTEVRDEAP